jgi:hypothetical protein
MSFVTDRKTRDSLPAPRSYYASEQVQGRVRRSPATIVPLDEVEEPVSAWFARPLEASNRPSDMLEASQPKPATKAGGLFAALFNY